MVILSTIVILNNLHVQRKIGWPTDIFFEDKKKKKKNLKGKFVSHPCFFSLLMCHSLQAAVLKEKFNIDLRVMGITGSRKMLLSDK